MIRMLLILFQALKGKEEVGGDLGEGEKILGETPLQKGYKPSGELICEEFEGVSYLFVGNKGDLKYFLVDPIFEGSPSLLFKVNSLDGGVEISSVLEAPEGLQ